MYNFSNSFLLGSGLYITWFDILGLLAIIFTFFAFYTKDKQSMRLYGLISTAFFGISIYFYGGVNGLFVTMVSIAIKILALSYEESKIQFIQKTSPIIALVFFFFFNSEGLIGILPAVSLIFIVIADTQETINKMKLWYFGSAFCWLFYAIVLNSIPAIIYDVIGIATLTYSAYTLNKINIIHFLNKYKKEGKK